jgi:hypothetical protein
MNTDFKNNSGVKRDNLPGRVELDKVNKIKKLINFFLDISSPL